METHFLFPLPNQTITDAQYYDDYVLQAVEYTKIFAISILNETRPISDTRPCFVAITAAPGAADVSGRMLARGKTSDQNDAVMRFSPPIKLKPGDNLYFYVEGQPADSIYFGYEADKGMKDLGSLV